VLSDFAQRSQARFAEWLFWSAMLKISISFTVNCHKGLSDNDFIHISAVTRTSADGAELMSVCKRRQRQLLQLAELSFETIKELSKRSIHHVSMLTRTFITD
jgi:hypothetical protein